MKSIDKTNSRTFSRRAFTLAELLIVVAIIAVLVGVSIPIFTSQLEKSREATDIANMRAAKAVAVQLYYEGVTDQATAAKYGLQYWGGNASNVANIWGVYDPDTGYFVSAKNFKDLKMDPYGQGGTSDGGTVSNGYNSTYNYTDAVLIVTIYPNGVKDTYKNWGFPGDKNTPCIVLEWRHTGSNTLFVGRDKSKFTGQVIFLE